MDGLTLRNARKLLDTGNTLKDISREQFISKKSDAQKTASGFADAFEDAILKVNTLQKSADKKMQMLATGKTSDISDVMITAEKAEIALKLMMTVRNKMIDAYQEIIKMQV